jgi:TPP-dependent pyruvate/acetoin dehydrogenase alpha subunit
MTKTRAESTTDPYLAKRLYREMVRIRLFEERTADLVEAGEIKTPVHLYIGQEAVAAGVCAALFISDYVLGNHRSHGHYLAKGGDMRSLMAEIYGKATGCALGRGGSMHLYGASFGFLGTVPMVAATIPIAAGAALAAQMEGSDRVTVAFFGDGATEEGVFHESLNFAALKALPMVFVCENNLFSSHLPLSERRPEGAALTEFALASRIPGVRVDGNDVLAVHDAAVAAVTRARRGGGPTLLECMTYRWRGHVGPSYDIDVGIRDRAELDAWIARCPIKALETHVGMAAKDIEAAYAEARAEVDDAVRFARESGYPPAEEASLHVFAPA